MSTIKTTTKENSLNYQFTVVKIDKLTPIENADRIQTASIFDSSTNIVVSKDNVSVGDIMVYFPSGTKLDADFCKFNNLFEDVNNNFDKKTKGYINNKQRVRAIKLKGVISDGLLLPPNCFTYCGIDYDDVINSLGVSGNKILTSNNIEINICEKYIVVESTNKSNTNKENNGKKLSYKVNRLIENQFYLHNDTANLRKNIHRLNLDDRITINYKKHGTSGVFANILVKKPLTKWYEKLLKKFGVNVVDTEYDIIYSSRKVVKNQYLNNNNLGGGFYGEDLWGTVAKEIGHLIPKNYTLYGEILGYTESGKEIQKGYDYGCLPNQHKFFVYKISVVNPDGYIIYLNDNQIKEFCDKNGLNFSETFFFSGTVRQLLQELSPIEYQREENFNSIEDEFGNIDYKWRSILLNALESKYNEKDCFMCKIKKVPEEGIVLRIENSMYNYEAYKLKSKSFLLHESEEQEQGIINIEDSE